MRRVNGPLVLAAGALFFYFAVDPGYHAAWVLALAGIWVLGIGADLASTFGRADMMGYESNRLLVGCVRRYGARRAVSVTVSYEVALVAALSVLLNRPAGFDVLDFMFVAGVFGAYHFYCAYCNGRFEP